MLGFLKQFAFNRNQIENFSVIQECDSAIFDGVSSCTMRVKRGNDNLGGCFIEELIEERIKKSIRFIFESRNPNLFPEIKFEFSEEDKEYFIIFGKGEVFIIFDESIITSFMKNDISPEFFNILVDKVQQHKQENKNYFSNITITKSA